MFGGLPTLSQSHPHRERVSHVIGLTLNANDMPGGDAGQGNLGRSDPHLGAGAESSLRLQTIFPVNIAIADKNPMVLSALEALLTRDRRFNLLLMASDGVHFLNSLAHLPVSLAVIGWELPPIRAPEM